MSSTLAKNYALLFSISRNMPSKICTSILVEITCILAHNTKVYRVFLNLCVKFSLEEINVFNLIYP